MGLGIEDEEEDDDEEDDEEAAPAADGESSLGSGESIAKTEQDNYARQITDSKRETPTSIEKKEKTKMTVVKNQIQK